MDDADTVTNGPPEGHQQHPPPSYDTDKEGYTGISLGALGNVGDLHDARNFAEMIVDTVREGLLVLDFGLHVLAANESFYRAFAVRPEDTVGQKVYDLGNGQWAIPELTELLERILPRQQTFNEYEVEHTFEDIGRRVILLNARRLDDHQLILLAIEDVTKRRRAEEELTALNETLERRVEEGTEQVRELTRALVQAEQEERQRIAHVLHEDLQQILVAAKMTLFATKLVVKEDADQLQDLLDKAIDLTRTLSHDMSQPVVQGDDLTELLQWVAERARGLYGLSVEVDGLASVPDQALGTLLCQLVREFLLNVVKHAGSGKARVLVDQDDQYVRVSVEDEGPGFDPTSLKRARGLGLSSARERLERVGGQLDVASAPGKGTRVTVTVPVRSG